MKNLRLYGEMKPTNPSKITRAQQGLFFSSNSPLTEEKQQKLRKEIREGEVTIVGSKEDL